MKLIRENIEDIEILIENTKDGKKSYFIEGVFLQGDIQNKNGRVYSFGILENEVNRYTEEYIKTGRALGELSHPDSPSINLERVSHVIKSLIPEGSNFIGKAKILDTPYGRIVKNFMDEGVKLGVSSRGLGTLEERNGVNYVKDDFRLATAADIVADPSAPDAFVNGIMESREWIYESGVLVAKEIEQYKKQISKAKVRQLEQTKLKIFENFLKKL